MRVTEGFAAAVVLPFLTMTFDGGPTEGGAALFAATVGPTGFGVAMAVGGSGSGVGVGETTASGITGLATATTSGFAGAGTPSGVGSLGATATFVSALM